MTFQTPLSNKIQLLYDLYCNFKKINMPNILKIEEKSTISDFELQKYDFRKKYQVEH